MADPITAPSALLTNVMLAANIIAIIFSLSKGLRALVAVRDELRDLHKAIGSKDPADGLLGDVDSLKLETRKHRDWLIELAAAVELRRHHRT